MMLLKFKEANKSLLGAGLNSMINQSNSVKLVSHSECNQEKLQIFVDTTVRNGQLHSLDQSFITMLALEFIKQTQLRLVFIKHKTLRRKSFVSILWNNLRSIMEYWISFLKLKLLLHG